MTDATLARALRYAAARWPVFPCRPGEKAPLGAATPHGVKDATTNPTTITAWWSRYPAANIAVATGAPGPDVVDIDTKDGRRGARSLAQLAAAGLLRGAHAVVVTPSGGYHLYFAGSHQRNGAMPRHGVDFRGIGGYVLAPPSTIDGQPYRIAEWRSSDALVDFDAIRRHLDPPRLAPQPTYGRNGDHRGLVQWMAGQTAGNRNNALYFAARRAIETGASAAVLHQLQAAAVGAGLTATEAARTIRSAVARQKTRG
ncbi:bifunctional DNA primase/polymerase [Phytohabitans rumicis]|uniref:DNA primase n=1 Tax=Phytohabitans rumicis TaxID=1076125 RepID=A0A6V8L9M4_9ACTN|nr:bifunctional DNA primase/polymerase [Phytohabitans rumicis]GFJ91708.1 DNA primase [Phytohabitans rumicis]